MMPLISLTTREQELDNLVIIISKLNRIPGGIFSSAEKRYLATRIEEHKQHLVTFNRIDYHVFVCFTDGNDRSARMEKCRKNGDSVAAILNGHHAKRVALFDADSLPDETLAVAEGIVLGSYRFLKHKSEQKEQSTLEAVEIYSKKLEEESNDGECAKIELLNRIHSAVFRCRDLINEPNSHLNATRFSEIVGEMGIECGASVEVLGKGRIEALKMGGLLGVNQGSVEPPTFTIMEWKPGNARNKKPVVLVGKGVMYDTGGMNLKPDNYMLNMKDDMSGAAAVASVVYALAGAKIPVHVIALMPATDNRPGDRALVPGDVITISNGTTVEVLNTDAEGRLILADALSYASGYDPMLVIDMATLTGSALRALGKYGAPAMQCKAEKELKSLIGKGFEVYERLVEFPLWEEYGEQIKSDLADLKNLGPPEAGLITAAKFLEFFTNYPYIHIDIAGPAFAEKHDSYRGLGGTGFGVRLLSQFLSDLVKD